MRVLHIVVELHRGGIETMIMNHLRHTDPALLQFDFVVHGDRVCEYEAEIREAGGQITRVTRPRSPAQFVKWTTQIRRALTTSRPDVVHCHLEQESRIVMQLARSVGIQARIVHSHNTASSRRGVRRASSRLIENSVSWQANRYLAASTEAGLWAFGPDIVTSADFSVFRNAVDLKEFADSSRHRDSIRREAGASASTLVVGHIGRFLAQKNHEFLLRAFADLHQRRPDSQLWLVGSGDLFGATEVQARALGIEKSARFWGVRPDIARLLAGMDVFALPSLHEGLPVVGVEAQASGLTCFFSDHVTPEAVITPSASFVPLQSGPSGWGQAMAEVTVGNRYDNLGLMRASGWDVADNATLLQKLYQDLCRQRATPGGMG